MQFIFMDEEKIWANALNQSLQIGPTYLKKIKEHFGSFEYGWQASIGKLEEITGKKDLKEFRKEINPEKEFKILEKEKIKILLKEELPLLLRETPLPPEILYFKGELPDQNQIHLAVVGTRRCSSYGKEACEKIVGELKDYEIVIVSGMALGIDSIAHKTALNNKMKTIAVLGSGLGNNVIYPRANYRLAEEIVNKGGCLISEYPFSMKATIFTFPQRNRIVAGLSKAAWVVEAPEKSGALITAFLALEYNRDVLALPGSIFLPNSKGTNNLLKLGASPVTSSEDILSVFGITPKTQTIQIEASPLEMEIASYLYEPLERDELIRKINKSPKEINPILTLMEIKGMIKEIGGKLHKII
ncbi:MAG: DNA-processing protein DprA [bacterium]|nr:DNA-processing protein DprA [bacterium]